MTSNANGYRKWRFLAILSVLLAGVIVYANTLHVPFILDDEVSISNNEIIKNISNFYANNKGYHFLPNRYVAYLTFALNYHFGGLNLTGFHVVNLLIHLATSLLVYALLCLTLRTPFFKKRIGISSVPTQGSNSVSRFLAPDNFIPLFGALIFTVHPVQTQAVTYIIQRVTSLATMFYLLSMVLYVWARLSIAKLELGSQNSEEIIKDHKGWTWPWIIIAGSVVAAVLAMKTKEIAFTLPFAIFLYEISFFRGPWKRRLLYLLPLLATLPIIPLTVISFGGPTDDILAGAENKLRVGSGLSRLDYLFTQFRVLVTYLRLLVLPINQNLDYDYPIYTTFFTPAVLLSFLLLLTVFLLGLYLFYISRLKPQPEPQPESLSRPLLRLIAFGIIWFFLTLAVESSFIPIIDVIMEHRLYLPAFGAILAFAAFFLLAAKKLSRPGGGILPILIAALIIFSLGFAGYQRNHIWGNALTLWQDVTEKSPNKGRSINNLGVVLENTGKRREAFKLFSKAIKVDPGYYKSYYNLADLYLVSDKPRTAIPLLQKCIRLNPDFSPAYVSMGAALMRSGQFRQVIRFLEQNINHVKDHVEDQAEARFYLGSAYAFLGNRQAAMRELELLNGMDRSYAASLAGMLGLKSGHGPATEKNRNNAD